jgi:hypothetical protein
LQDKFQKIDENAKLEQSVGCLQRYYIVSYIANVILLLISVVFIVLFVITKNKYEEPVIPKESMIPITKSIYGNVSGAAEFIGKIDIRNSPYFSGIDFYNDKPTDTLKILKNFKTYQQTSEFSAAVSCALMVLNYLGITNTSEKLLAEQASNNFVYGTTNELLTAALKLYGVEVENCPGSDDNPFENEVGFKNYVIESIENNQPILIQSVVWGGTWQVIIVYDDMGTETTLDDVLIVADPYDTGDHRQDGYITYNAEKFMSLVDTKWLLIPEGQQKWSYIRVSKKKA